LKKGIKRALSPFPFNNNNEEEENYRVPDKDTNNMSGSNSNNSDALPSNDEETSRSIEYRKGFHHDDTCVDCKR
jgi:hypothetical protein